MTRSPDAPDGPSAGPDAYLDCVVAIGHEDTEGDVAWVASGFLYGHPLRVDGQPCYQVYLVTNRHVFEGTRTAVLRCNPRGRRPAREFTLQLEDAHGHQTWLGHRRPSVDVAVVPINYELLRRHGIAVSFFGGDVHVATRRRWQALHMGEGDIAFVLGFPMGLVGGRRNTVIVRSGTIARVRDTLEGTSDEFLLDAFVFPGNSGGPVLLATPNGPPLLIGMIHAYVPYQDVAVSMQTQRPRVIFEENSGLSAAHPIDLVVSVIRRHQRAQKARGGPRRPPSPPRRRAAPARRGRPPAATVPH